VASVGLAGRGWVDLTATAAIWQNMRDPRLPLDLQFMLSSPLTLFLGWPIARIAGGAVAFRAVTAVGIGFLAIALVMWARAISRAEPWVPLFLVLAAPITIVCARYLGKSDTFLLAFVLLLMTSRSPVVQILCGAAAVASHREIGTLAVLLCGIIERDSLTRCLAAVAIGNLLVLGYHTGFLTYVPESRPGYAYRHASLLVEQASSHPIAHLMLSFGGFFLHAFAAAKRRLIRAEHGIVIAVAVAAALAASDFTRVFTIVAFPVTLTLTAALVRSGYGDRMERVPIWWMLPLVLQFQISGFTIAGLGGIF
jgi:hypothetical protein